MVFSFAPLLGPSGLRLGVPGVSLWGLSPEPGGAVSAPRPSGPVEGNGLVGRNPTVDRGEVLTVDTYPHLKFFSAPPPQVLPLATQVPRCSVVSTHPFPDIHVLPVPNPARPLGPGDPL